MNFTRRTLIGGALALPALPALAHQPVRKLFDSHLHFFTNDIARYPIDPRGAREPEAVMRARIMEHPGTPETIFPLWKQAGVVAGAGVQYSGAYKTDNRYILDLADQHPDKIRAEIIVDGKDPASAAKVQQLATQRRVSAIRMTGYVNGPDLAWFDSPAALDVWAAAEKLRLPVGITFLPVPGREAPLVAIKALATRFPRCIILLEHMGRLVDGDLSPAHIALREHRNVHFKLTTNVIDELKATARIPVPAFVRRAAGLYGIERLMWGSDLGNTLRPYPAMVADAIAATSALTPKEAQRLLHDNGAAMFARRP